MRSCPDLTNVSCRREITQPPSLTHTLKVRNVPRRIRLALEMIWSWTSLMDCPSPRGTTNCCRRGRPCRSGGSGASLKTLWWTTSWLLCLARRRLGGVHRWGCTDALPEKKTLREDAKHDVSNFYSGKQMLSFPRLLSFCASESNNMFYFFYLFLCCLPSNWTQIPKA